MQRINLYNWTLRKFKMLSSEVSSFPLFLALSAGKDSSALAHVLLRLRNKLPEFEWLHVNYSLRGFESDQDEEFLREWAKKERVVLHVKKVKEKKPSQGIQQWARDIRYDFFNEIMSVKNGAMLVTAHHLDDQVETFLQRLISGAGLAGLEAIPELSSLKGKSPIRCDNFFEFKKNNYIFRPWLHVNNDVVLQYISDHQVVYREDRSNKELYYQRNRIRHHLMPVFFRENPKFVEHVQKIVRQISTLNNANNYWVQQWLNEHCECVSSNAYSINCDDFFTLPLSVQHSVIFGVLCKLFPQYRNRNNVVEESIKFLASIHKKMCKMRNGTQFVKEEKIFLALKDGWKLACDRNYITFYHES